jgi:hypothetical protein
MIELTGTRAEAVLRSACETLLRTSPDVVSALSVSIARHEAGGTIEEWAQVAAEMAEQYELRAQVTMPRSDVHVRFSRYTDGRATR